MIVDYKRGIICISSFYRTRHHYMNFDSKPNSLFCTSVGKGTGMCRRSIPPHTVQIGQQKLEMILSILIAAPSDSLGVIQDIPSVVADVL